MSTTPSPRWARVPARIGRLAVCVMFASCAADDLPPGHLTVSSSAPLDFGLAGCGFASPALAVTIANDEGASPVHWSAKLDGPFALDSASSGVLPGHTSVVVRLHASVPVASIAGAPLGGTLRIENDASSQPALLIPLRVTPEGAMLRLPSFPLEFGEIPLSEVSPWLAATLVNDGNAPADIAMAAPSNPQFLVANKSLWLPPGGKGELALRFAPVSTGVTTGSAAVAVAGPVCGALGPLLLQGKGTKGVVLTSPGSLDFGLVDCGTMATSRKILVENKGDGPFSFIANLTSGVDFTVVPPTATVVPGASVEVTVTPNAIPSISAVSPDLYGDTLTLTTTVPGDSAHVIPIHETARGMILALSAPSQTIRALVDAVTSVPATLANLGNVVVNDAKLVTVDNALSSAPTTLGPNSSAPVTLEARPDPSKLGVAQNLLASFQTTSSVPNCGGPAQAPTVTAYDLAVDVSVNNASRYVLGHTKRVYRSNAAPYVLVQGTPVADEISMSGLWLRSGTTLAKFDPQTQTSSYYALPATWAKLDKPADAPHWCATEVNGDLWCVGYNQGQWGNGQLFVDSSSPVSAFPSIRPISDYASSHYVGFVVHQGEVWGSGNNGGYSLGNSTLLNNQSSAMPIQVEGLSDAVRVSAGSGGGCAIRATGEVSCWGEGNPAQQPVAGISSAVELAGDGPSSGCVVLSNGAVQCWGGQVSAYYVSMTHPKRLVSDRAGQACAIEAGDQFSCWSTSGGQPLRELGFEGP